MVYMCFGELKMRDFYCGKLVYEEKIRFLRIILENPMVLMVGYGVAHEE
jgi:hypothetical protein